MATWQLQEAKNKLSELIDKVESEGPQVITRHGTEVVAVIRYADLKKTSKRIKLGDFLLKSPLKGSGLAIERDRDVPMREFDIR